VPARIETRLLSRKSALRGCTASVESVESVRVEIRTHCRFLLSNSVAGSPKAGAQLNHLSQRLWDCVLAAQLALWTRVSVDASQTGLPRSWLVFGTESARRVEGTAEVGQASGKRYGNSLEQRMPPVAST
jgi:hypothetical protein